KKNFMEINVIDEDDIDKMQLQHHLLREYWKGNFSAPVREILSVDGTKVLDVGCGPGTWTCEMSSDFSKAKYTAVDINSVFPKIKPKNVEFVQCDILKGLPFDDNTFDYVFLRFLIIHLTEVEWETILIRELCRVCKPGGWIELMEPMNEIRNTGPVTSKLCEKFHTRIRNQKRNFNVNRFHKLMIENHLININHQCREMPFGLNDIKSELGLDIMRERLKKHLQFERVYKGKIEDMLNKVAVEAKVHNTYIETHRFWGQKELSSY
ncbi:5536_t:CDS:2, partial [Acaulospora morrowiae]